MNRFRIGIYIYIIHIYNIHCNIWIDTYIIHICIKMYRIDDILIYKYIYTVYIYIYMLTFVIMKVLCTSKSRPSTTEHNEKKQNAIPAAEFSMSFAASAVWPPATVPRFGTKPTSWCCHFDSDHSHSSKGSKKTAWHWNLQPAISLSGNPFSCRHCFFEATLTCRTLWARAHQLLSLSAEMGTIFQSSPGVTWDGNSIKG